MPKRKTAPEFTSEGIVNQMATAYAQQREQATVKLRVALTMVEDGSMLDAAVNASDAVSLLMRAWSARDQWIAEVQRAKES